MTGFTFTASVLWLLPLVLAILLWIRFLRGRRREIVAGSLLLWKKLAVQQPLTPPRRFVMDRSLLLQALALTALVAALARPEFDARSGGRTVVVAVDNGPLSRFRGTNVAPLWSAVKVQARTALSRLESSDRVLLVRAAPFPKLLTPEPVRVADARALLDTLAPALSETGSENLFAFARNTQRSSNASALAVISAAPAPEAAANGAEWIGIGATARQNVGIVAFGAAVTGAAPRERVQCMVRIHNAADQPRAVPVQAKQGGIPLLSKTCEIPAGGDEAVWIDGVDPARPVEFSIESDDGLLDDNTITALPARSERLRVRFHAPQPALQRLFATATGAEILPADSNSAADLEVYVGTPPQQLSPRARALLLIEPSTGYRFFFEVGDARLTSPVVLRDEPSPLTDNFKTGEGEGAGLFPVPTACEILRTGSYTSLLKDARSQRTLALRFMDENGCPGYALAFTPGAGMSAEAYLPAELAALLIRMLRDAAGNAEPFNVTTAAAWEAQHDAPAPAHGAVLNEAVTALKSPSASPDASAWLTSTPTERRMALRPWLIALALFLLAADLLLSRTAPHPHPA